MQYSLIQLKAIKHKPTKSILNHTCVCIGLKWEKLYKASYVTLPSDETGSGFKSRSSVCVVRAWTHHIFVWEHLILESAK